MPADALATCRMRYALLLLLWLPPLSLRAMPLEVATGTQQSAVSVMDWCLAAPPVSIETISTDGCLWRPLAGTAISRGLGREAYWLRLDLSNSGAQPVERWISVGHPRMAEISLFTRTATGWVRRDIGNHIPMARRGEVERDQGVLPVQLLPQQTVRLWLRVYSDTVVDLSTTVWRPADYLHKHQTLFFWATLAQGGVLLTILFSLFMFGLTRQPAYVYFAIGLSGALVNASLASGVLQHYLWPANWPIPSQLIAASALLTVLGYYAFMRHFLSQDPQYRGIDRLLKASILLSSMVLLYGITVDFTAGGRVWGGCIALALILASIRTYLAWRNGETHAGFLLLAFAMYLTATLLRLSLAASHGRWIPEIAIMGSWGLVLSAPVILLGLVQRTRQLLAELSRAEADNMMQLTFLAQMSHELRSPLDTVLGNTQLLMRRQKTASTQEALSTIAESGQQLLRMIDHILDYSRGLAGVIRIRPAAVSLDPFLRGIKRSARLLAARQGNQFAFRVSGETHPLHDLTVSLDADALRRVLDNLICNAARHTHNGLITLHLEVRPAGSSQIRLDFSVADTGEGIAPEHLERIFNPFERVPQSRGQEGKGAGLGLAIARQLTELMGGQISVESTPGEGTRFHFWVLAPTAPADNHLPLEVPEEFEAAGYLGRQRTLLIVDDEAGNRHVLAELFNDLGFLVVQAESGRQARRLLQNLAELDLVITDQYMPDGDGWEVLEGLATHRPEIPALLISGAPPNPPPHRTVPLHFAAHFFKPLNHPQLLRYMSDLLGLTWTRAVTPPPPKSPDCTAAETPCVPGISGGARLPALAASELSVLAGLVDTGQITAIKEWAVALSEQYPQHAPFADQVLSAAQALDMPALHALTRSHRETTRPPAP